MKDLIFSFLLGSDETVNDALRLARSIRTFAGEYCFNPIWMFSQQSEEDISEETRAALYSIGARLVTFDRDDNEADFPFTAYVTASSLAEGLAQGETGLLVMMASDTLVLNEPSPLRLDTGKSFGGCPVHLKLLGSGYDEPINDFWEQVYHYCRVDQANIFPVRTIVDEQSIRAYFNAGLLVVRPERGLLRRWYADFKRIFQLPEFISFYAQSELYKLFMHQAVLAGTLLSSLRPDEFQQFSCEVNYPLHLHSRILRDHRISSLDQLTTCRYEDFNEVFRDPHLRDMIHIDAPLMDWLLTNTR